MNVPVLSAEEQTRTLRWARQAIESAVRYDGRVTVTDTELTPTLLSPYAAFVTLRKQAELRGCIGKLDFAQPLWKNLLDAAVASAQEDPRFPAVAPDELAEIRLEISVLDRPVELSSMEFFDPLRHGIILEKGFHHALLLPKVAQEQGWDARRTLETVCWKAGLPPDAWRDSDATLKIFDVFDYAEASAGCG